MIGVSIVIVDDVEILGFLHHGTHEKGFHDVIPHQVIQEVDRVASQLQCMRKEFAHHSILKIKLVLHEYAIRFEEKYHHLRDDDSSVTFFDITVSLKYRVPNQMRSSTCLEE